MFDTFKNRLEITGTLTTVTALRISAGRSTEPIGSDLPVIKDALGRPLIPGSSFKGALRSRLESFLRGIDPNLAEDPANYTTSTRNNQVKAFKEKYKNNDLNLTQELIGITDDIGSLFGTPWMASKFQVRDLTVQPDAWFGQYQERDGVAIDRDTETAADGKLYDYQVVPAATPFDFKAVVENAHDWELGLLMIGLHQFETEQIPLGGGRSRGLGVVKLEIDKMRWVDVENHPKFLLEYLQKLVMGDETAYEDAADYKDEWVQKLIDRLTPQQAKSSETLTQTQ
ncbi:MAG: CRISPR-associated RAMP protein [Microcoleus sp. PH2017_40_RAT_O_B]|uniref:type III CRISPR-associated RAMP protein Csx7 n=1 Tax=unclassified Microcoleus TaxID=2642155 RepID=UPI001D2255AF|nr:MULTISPECIES: CRISPR-associated RAMP protein Csx7 [unclassified Microcoleus]TAF97005.1 MAG: CRISPR-associated RAMP protein [Oscillatoriales cyanobacterium]MCC3438166.1 CRISPR-associated RAMP protein [Microcoleus sp. PH2017_05_CCC_O_A]MCC3574839.1 CRISPR-associated RAMP protein [Microcoleus sp. PH2017_34_RAT_O_A]MCC3612456.1 CRISPR-associated RAMP protein [Microcoleus sp. PH2017_40_RAT_O_B]TAG19149.1 MAG: CRISPR-associated RAMP protein [Oscillatoriales cyanobacterium]